jgi:hypothetical protein
MIWTQQGQEKLPMNKKGLKYLREFETSYTNSMVGIKGWDRVWSSFKKKTEFNNLVKLSL